MSEQCNSTMSDEELDLFLDETFAKEPAAPKTVEETAPSHTVKQLPVEVLKTFDGHPYKVRDDEEMKELAESVKEYGIITPVTVRKLGNAPEEYEVISGHRRLFAAVKAGLKTVPAFVYDIDRDAAAVMLVDSNLHREHILPSEKAFAYKLKYEAPKRQGKRNDLTLSQPETKLRTDEIIAYGVGESRAQIQRYMRLTNLLPGLLDLMDEGKIALSVGVELSYLSEEQQRVVLNAITELDCTPSYSQANRMHKDFNNGTLTEESIREMLCAEKPNQKAVYKFAAEKFGKYFSPETTQKDAEDYILKACDYYEKHLRRNRDRDAR